MGALYWEDVSDLTLFKCKICTHRLQYPIVEVKTLGNICGSCYEKSAYTDVRENTDIERILSKLCIPCRYTERGCYFDGSFEDTSEHEKRCPFRDKFCPFSSIDKCESVGIIDVIEHIKTEHTQDFTKVALEGDYFKIQETIEESKRTHPGAFYLFEFHKRVFLLHSRLDGENYYYALYHFNDDDIPDKTSVCFIAEFDDLTIKSKKINAIPHGEIINFFRSGGLRLSAATMANFRRQDGELKLFLSAEDHIEPSVITWFSCTKCEKDIIDGARFCSDCVDSQICNDCYQRNKNCSKCSEQLIRKLDVCAVNPAYKIKCRYDGCNQSIRKDAYKSHLSKCKFKMHNCLFKYTAINAHKCDWTGRYADFLAHMLKTHVGSVFANAVAISISADESPGFKYVIRNNLILLCTYKLTKDKVLWIKMGSITENNHGSYEWELHFKYSAGAKSTIISSTVCSMNEVQSEKINVSNYMVDGKLKFDVCVRHKTVRG